MRRLLAIVLAVICFSSAFADGGDGVLYTFSPDAPPTGLGFLVSEYSGTVTVTFLGDCTLGGEKTSAKKTAGFVQTVERNGMEWPFRNLVRLTAADDITVANLEGVLSDRNLSRVEKTFNFIGPTAYTEILHLGSIECVTLANNHTYDFGRAGYLDTREALDNDGIAYFGTDCLSLWSRDGIQIGFVGVSGKADKTFEENVALLRELGCDAIIVYMHAGREGTGTVIGNQRQIAKKAATLGCDLVIGSHPHVVQGMELIAGMPVVYSLGNCSFGGNHLPDDMDALVVQADLTFEEGELIGMLLHVYPISVSSVSSRNDFSPVLLTGKNADRVLQKMKASTGFAMPAFDEEQGSVLWIER